MYFPWEYGSLKFTMNYTTIIFKVRLLYSRLLCSRQPITHNVAYAHCPLSRFSIKFIELFLNAKPWKPCKMGEEISSRNSTGFAICLNGQKENIKMITDDDICNYHWIEANLSKIKVFYLYWKVSPDVCESQKQHLI